MSVGRGGARFWLNMAAGHSDFLNSFLKLRAIALTVPHRGIASNVDTAAIV
jgi:hypothetical protein